MLADCTAHSAALPRLELLYDLPLLLSSAVAQPLAALLPYGCGTPLAGAALESERKCSVITCCRWHNIAASAAKPPRQTIASLYKSKVGGNCVRLTNRRQSDSEDRSKPSRIATPPGRHPIRQAPQLFKLLACNVKTFLLGDLKGAVLFCEREQPPLPRSLLARRDNFALHWKSFSSSSLLISKLSTSTSAFVLKCSGSSSLLHSALRFSTLSGPIRPRS